MFQLSISFPIKDYQKVGMKEVERTKKINLKANNH